MNTVSTTDNHLPSALNESGVTGRQVGAGKVQVQDRLAQGLVAGVKQL